MTSSDVACDDPLNLPCASEEALHAVDWQDLEVAERHSRQVVADELLEGGSGQGALQG